MNPEDVMNFNGMEHPQILIYSKNSVTENESVIQQNKSFRHIVPLDVIHNGRFLMALGSFDKKPLVESMITHLILLDMTTKPQEIKHVYKLSKPTQFSYGPFFLFLHGLQSVVTLTEEDPTSLEKITLKEMLNHQEVNCFEVLKIYSVYEIIKGDTSIVIENVIDYTLQVFNCKGSFDEICFIERNDKIDNFEFHCGCFFDNDSKIAMISGQKKFLVIKVSSKCIQMKDFSFLFNGEESGSNFFVSLHNIYLESSRINNFFAILDNGTILDINNEKVMTSSYFEQFPKAERELLVSESHLCNFNNWIYMFSFSKHCLVVFDPLKCQTIYMYELGCLPAWKTLKIDWFGSVGIYNGIKKIDKDILVVEKIFKRKAMPLTYLSRMVIFSTYSLNQLREMNFSKPLKAVVFDNM